MSSSTTPVITYEFCDADTLPAELTSLSSLEYNQFYKLCPGLQQDSDDGTTLPLGQPRCGDNSNYSFFVTRPAAAADDNGEKIVIELSGGGACWDSITCTLQSSQLAFPTLLNPFVGASCASFASLDTLCSKTIADIDFTTYNYILLPYCTQDIHLGDAASTEYGVAHVGSHNLYRTLLWIFENYPKPEHIVLTGCSAGATPLPVVYDLINRHYQNADSSSSSSSSTTTSASSGDGGGVNVPIDVIADSSVFLTPEYFLDNYISNWNLNTIMEKIDFDFEAVKDQTDFSVSILDHVLDRSKSNDDLVYTFHDADEVSQFYYEMMSGMSLMELLADDGGRRLRSLSLAVGGYTPTMDHGITFTNSHRGLSDDDLQSQWLTELENSVELAGVGHSNFHVYFMEGTEHCSYGLNVPLEYTGFEEWVSTILQDDLSSESSTVQSTNAPSQQPVSSPPTSDGIINLENVSSPPTSNSATNPENVSSLEEWGSTILQDDISSETPTVQLTNAPSQQPVSSPPTSSSIIVLENVSSPPTSSGTIFLENSNEPIVSIAPMSSSPTVARPMTSNAATLEQTSSVVFPAMIAFLTVRFLFSGAR